MRSLIIRICGHKTFDKASKILYYEKYINHIVKWRDLYYHEEPGLYVKKVKEAVPINTVICHICDIKNEIQVDEPSICVRCGADLADVKFESKILGDTFNATYSTSDSMTDPRKEANIYLTDKRLIVIPAKLQGVGLAGVAAAAFYNNVFHKAGIISIPLYNVKSVRDGKFGLLVKALIVDTTDGELVKMTFSKREVWKEAISKAVNDLR